MPRELTPTITLYTRKDWGARAPRGAMDRHTRKVTEAFIHHTTDRLAEHFTTLADQKAAMRAIQSYHMNANGWKDIGYTYLVFQAYGSIPHARIFAGRDDRCIPAAQLEHNNGTLPVCVVGNFTKDDHVLRNTRHAIAVLLNVYPDLVTLGGHRDVVNTECPGDTLYKQIPTIASNANLKVYR